MEFWQKLFSGQGFMPRRMCGLWDGSLISLHVVSDVVIWLAYLWIPIVMLWGYLGHRGNLRLHRPAFWILVLYTTFITACGWTHFFDALMFVNPVYRLNGLVRAITAFVSLGTAVSLVKLVPIAISAPATILTQQASLRQQHAWLRDILDSATDGKLKLCGTRADLPEPLGPNAVCVEVAGPDDLRRVRRMAHELARAAGLDRGRTDELTTAVHETVMNALVHAKGAQARGFHSADRVQVWVEDKGAGIALDKLPISTLKQGFSTAATAGQGWFITVSLIDAAYLLTGAEGTTVVLEARQAPPQRAVPFSTAVGGDVPA
jgi:anti-sigma regulatory factor (Ser/Thr protein kinase)